MTAAPVASVGDELLLGGEQHRLLEPALIQIYIGLPIRVIHSSALLGAPMNLLLGSIIAVDDASIEIVERKGVGHPDTICDALAENLSPMLCREYRGKFGHILHHNVDKALLCGGRAQPAFGGGTVLVPINILPGRSRGDGSRRRARHARRACRSRPARLAARQPACFGRRA
jgi:hypothetical protein